MRIARLIVLSLFAGSLFAACGGDDGESMIDAPIMIDAPPDAPPIPKLGKVCNASTPCSAEAPDCLTVGAGATSGFCSLLCHADAMFMTDGSSPPAVVSGTDLTADNSKCTAQFVGTAGVASCFLPLNRTPAGALMANTTYTFQAYCAVRCGTGTPMCPTGLTCNSNGLCAP
ncbi:MAG: hypothetical protein H0T42_10785 [Deltaproteobacteria bacterium]|nr:hypothetical protein [Deltaproteobacteria bacterium]